ncbi:MAG: tetratricopeptide repeat protein [Gammaproteobacteria bacterium]|nr:tetratricopeptide repeat protein [Gammaproteobacteria bacterium]
MKLSRLAGALAVGGSILAGCAAPRPIPRDEGIIPPSTAPADRYGIAPPVPRDADIDDFPRSAEEISGPAVVSLLNQANGQRRGGRPEQAVAVLERAVRIEPRNPFVWQALAAAHLENDRPEPAETAAQKSNSLARGNPFIEVENWRLIAQARAARGDNGGARVAQQRASELERALDD